MKLSSCVLCLMIECLYKCIFALFKMTFTPAASNLALDTVQIENDFVLGKLLQDLKSIADRYRPIGDFIQSDFIH
jgi:hypothetical protein